ncbi:MAG: hypothetical protein WB523_02170 [Candidatus Sulfotelmatobacter sp.]
MSKPANVPSMPQVDISTGAVTDGPNGGVTVNEQFQWINASSNSCIITAPANPVGGPWFSGSPCTVNANNAPPNKGIVTALLEGDWTFGDTCNRRITNPKVPVGGNKPGPKPKPKR